MLHSPQSQAGIAQLLPVRWKLTRTEQARNPNLTSDRFLPSPSIITDWDKPHPFQGKTEENFYDYFIDFSEITAIFTDSQQIPPFHVKNWSAVQND